MDVLSRFYARLRPTPQSHWGYPIRVALEEAIQDPASGISGVAVADAFREAKAPASGPFNGLCFALCRATGEAFWREAFVEEARRPLASDFPKSKEGAWTHPRGRQLGGRGILIDSFQEEASRVIKWAWLIRQGEVDGEDPERLEAAAVDQFWMHRTILRDPDTGLWHNARGWAGPDRLSPGFWSRGHGWLMRGIEQAIRHLPPGARRERLAELFVELTESLLAVRAENGLWPAMLAERPGRSPVETSGSAMIVAALVHGLREGLLSEEIRPVVTQAALRLISDYLTENGEVLNACPGPGPLRDPQPYYAPVDWPKNEPHGVAGIAALLRTGIAGDFQVARSRKSVEG